MEISRHPPERDTAQRTLGRIVGQADAAVFEEARKGWRAPIDKHDRYALQLVLAFCVSGSCNSIYSIASSTPTPIVG
jgi:hypothetical protein